MTFFSNYSNILLTYGQAIMKKEVTEIGPQRHNEKALVGSRQFCEARIMTVAIMKCVVN